MRYEYNGVELLEFVHFDSRLDSGDYVTTATIEYRHDDDGRIIEIISPDGRSVLDGTVDLRGRTTGRTDVFENSASFSFEVDTITGERITSVQDQGNANAVSATAHGMDALLYVEQLGDQLKKTDSQDRTTFVQDSLGSIYEYGYAEGNLLPTEISVDPNFDKLLYVNARAFW